MQKNRTKPNLDCGPEKSARCLGCRAQWERGLRLEGSARARAGEPVNHRKGLHSVLKAMGEVLVEEVLGRGKLRRQECALVQVEEGVGG